jgi:hypothetical protein
MLETRLANAADIEGILALQALNLYTNLSEEARKEGFVTTPFTAAQISELLAENSVFVASDGQKILGYAYAATWSWFSQYPIFEYMIGRNATQAFKGEILTNENSFQYGPVCIDHSLRGTDAFPRLFATLRESMSARYPIGGTFINKSNLRSMKAHTQKLGLEVFDEFEFNGQEYYSLAFFTKV